MNRDSQDFETLRRLLALKRHEQPPPGYFNDFSRRVTARIEAGERGDEPAGWWQRLWAMLEARPVLAGAFGAAVCAVLVTGMLGSAESEPTTATILPQPVFPSTAMAENASAHPQVFNSTNQGGSIEELFRQNELKVVPVSAPLDLLPGN